MADALVLDKRDAIAGPGVHALIVGVSDYLYLPAADEPPSPDTWHLTKLTSAALSAFKLYEWLSGNELRLPLKTVRVLLSPSTSEREAEPALAALALPADAAQTVPRASRKVFEEAAWAWRSDVLKRRDDMALFYFAGHGLQRTVDEGVLLFDDFLLPGPPPLANCALVGNLRAGLTPSIEHPDIAQTQVMFIDACQLTPESLARFVNPQVPDVFGPAAFGPVDHRESAVLFSTLNRGISVGRDGAPSYFAASLLKALDRAAEDPEERDGPSTVWPVTARTIKTAIDRAYAQSGLGIKVKMDDNVGDPVIRYLQSPPDVDLSIEIDPSDLDCQCLVLDDGDNSVPPGALPVQKTRFDVPIKAGFYRVEVGSARLTASPHRSGLKFITQKSSHWRHFLRASVRQ